MNAIQIFPIGKIENADGNTRIVLQNEYAAGLKELAGYSHALVLWWMDGCDNARDRSTRIECKSISDCKIWKRNGDGICRAVPIANFYRYILLHFGCGSILSYRGGKERCVC